MILFRRLSRHSSHRRTVNFRIPNICVFFRYSKNARVGFTWMLHLSRDVVETLVNAKPSHAISARLCCGNWRSFVQFVFWNMRTLKSFATASKLTHFARQTGYRIVFSPNAPSTYRRSGCFPTYCHQMAPRMEVERRAVGGRKPRRQRHTVALNYRYTVRCWPTFDCKSAQTKNTSRTEV